MDKLTLSIKENVFKREEEFLSPFATLSKNTLGRQKQEEPCPMRTEFQRDRDRIIYSKAFIRLKNKTQVFFSPEGDHYMTRLTHTLDVSQIARSIARSLMLNEDLTEAIALGHDLGHTPFGHAGERCLDKLSPFGFKHNEQSLRVVDVLEKDFTGLNLTKEVRDGIINHKMNLTPMTNEGKIVSLADRIAYLNHDVDDAIRAGIIVVADLPKEVKEILGTTSRQRINTMINSVYQTSFGKNTVEMGKEVLNAMASLRKYMFEKVYLNDYAQKQEERAFRMFSSMYEYFNKDVTRLPTNYLKLTENYDKNIVICDYLSSMTDRYALTVFNNIFVPDRFN